MRGKHALFGWRVNITELGERFQAVKDTIGTYKRGPTASEYLAQADGSDDSSLVNSSGSAADGSGSSCAGEFDVHSLRFDQMVYALARSVGLRPYVSVVGDVVWLTRNYISPRGRVGTRGLSPLPDETLIKAFTEKAGLDQPGWLLLRP